jgi:hypothetical protein
MNVYLYGGISPDGVKPITFSLDIVVNCKISMNSGESTTIKVPLTSSETTTFTLDDSLFISNVLTFGTFCAIEGFKLTDSNSLGVNLSL